MYGCCRGRFLWVLARRRRKQRNTPKGRKGAAAGRDARRMPPGPMLRRDLEAKAEDLRTRLIHEEGQRKEMRQSGRQMLQLADTILQGVEHSLEADGAGGMTARAGLAGNRPLPPIDVALRPETAEQ